VTRSFSLAVALLLPLTAWADRRDLYTQLALGPTLLTVEDHTHAGARASQAAILAEGVISYGLTHTFQVGGLLHGTATWNAAIPRTSRLLPDGTGLEGTLYLDSWSVGVGPLVAWRLDTGRAIAPLVRMEVGAVYRRYRRVEFVPTDPGVALAQPSWSEVALGGRVMVGVELRCADHLSATLGVGLRHTFGASIPWQLDVPIAAGLIW
jgi:hypothetical protein